MNKLFSSLVLLVALLTGISASAEFNRHRSHKPVNKTTTADPAENNYDVHYLKFNLHVTDTSVYVAGDVATTAMVVSPTGMGSYVFELDTTLTIDSAKIDGTPVSVTGTGVVRTISLPVMLATGTSFTSHIYYHGMPPGGSGSFFNGITHMVTSGGTNVVFTVSDPYVAMNWWPAKQNVDDKIDSVDMLVTVPPGVVDGSNGVLLGVDSTTNPGSWTYHWHTNYKIDYYLISIAVARYAEYKSYCHFSGSTDSVLIQNFFLDTATFNPLYKSNFDSIGLFLDYFSSLYGRYPFWQEKYGVCYTTLPGGMEHQTMTTIGVPNTYIIAHEMCHQWFGDHVTYRTWGDVWLSEGFATFSEQLFLDHFWSPAAARTHRQQYLANVLSRPCGRLYVNDTTTSDSLFYEPTVYAKGQAVVTMLRYIAPSDSVFFAALRTYQQNFAFGLASTADLQSVFEAAYGVPLDTFFNEWVYGSGYPTYKVYWNQSGSNVYLRLVQTASCTSTPLFSTPLELQLQAGSVDTTFRIYNYSDTQNYTFTWSQPMTNAVLNPDILTICKTVGLPQHDPTLGIGSTLTPLKLQVVPNPTPNNWELLNAPGGMDIELCALDGQLLWSGKSHAGTTVIPAAGLAAGNYLLRLNDNGQLTDIKVTHW